MSASEVPDIPTDPANLCNLTRLRHEREKFAATTPRSKVARTQ